MYIYTAFTVCGFLSCKCFVAFNACSRTCALLCAHALLKICYYNLIVYFYFSTDRKTVTNMMNVAQDTVKMEEVTAGLNLRL